MDISTINWLAVFVAGVMAFLVGGIWYGPLFGKAWIKANNFTEEQLARRNMAVVFGVSLLLALVASFFLAAFIGPDAGVGFGAFAGAAAGVGWFVTFTGIQYLFEMRRASLLLINGGYSVVTLTAMGAILGAW